MRQKAQYTTRCDDGLQSSLLNGCQLHLYLGRTVGAYLEGPNINGLRLKLSAWTVVTQVNFHLRLT